MNILFILCILHIVSCTVRHSNNCTVIRVLILFYVANCTSTWVEIDNNAAGYRQGEYFYVSASSLKQCQEACEFNRRCVAIDWRVYRHYTRCVIITNPNHEHRTWYNSTHYELVSRCNISTGVFCSQHVLLR